MRHLSAARGFTLIELIIASGIAVVVILTVGQIDVTRTRLVEQVIRPQTTFMTDTALAGQHLIKYLMQADRVNLISAGNIQLRIPVNRNALDANAGYRWAQYRLIDTNGDGLPDEIHFYDDTVAGCGVDAKFGGAGSGNFVYTSGLVITYKDETITPPGGEPPQQDNNVLEVSVSRTWTDLTTSQSTTVNSTGEVTIRAGAYTDLATGLAPAGISDPPAVCNG